RQPVLLPKRDRLAGVQRKAPARPLLTLSQEFLDQAHFALQLLRLPAMLACQILHQRAQLHPHARVFGNLEIHAQYAVATGIQMLQLFEITLRDGRRLRPLRSFDNAAQHRLAVLSRQLVLPRGLEEMGDHLIAAQPDRRPDHASPAPGRLSRVTRPASSSSYSSSMCAARKSRARSMSRSTPSSARLWIEAISRIDRHSRANSTNVCRQRRGSRSSSRISRRWTSALSRTSSGTGDSGLGTKSARVTRSSESGRR